MPAHGATAAVVSFSVGELSSFNATGSAYAEDGHGLGLHATTGSELAKAIEVALANREGPSLIECVIDRSTTRIGLTLRN